MGRDLTSILEMQFNLMYYLRMSISDFDNQDVSDLEWLYSRLIKQKKNEIEEKKKVLNSGRTG